ncbi:MAG: antibiotic biosynthesis monooxygenase family protein [Desulfotignum sp.]
MLFPVNRETEALEILSSMIEQIKVEPGCIDCRLYRGIQSPHTVLFEQSWDREEDLLQHLRSDRYAKILLVLEMAMEPPEVRFNCIHRSHGMEFITFARCQAG